ncbi:MAG: RNA-guided endonuclease TnpB family protein [Acidimicrobiales bacterium]
MGKLEIPPGWVFQAYRFEVGRPSRHQAIASHEGAKRFAWNWALRLVGDLLDARSVYRALALRQGATSAQAEQWSTTMVPIPWSMEGLRRYWNDEKDLSTARTDTEWAAAVECIHARKVYEVLALREGATAAQARRFAQTAVPSVGWWSENSKECYSSAFEVLARAFTNYFDSRSGARAGPQVGWPKYKPRSGRKSVSFTTGAIAILDRHHVKLPVIGRLRVKEPTDKLRLGLGAGTARVLRATLVTDSAKTFVSFSVLARRTPSTSHPKWVCGHDVGISLLITSSDGHVVENAKPAAKARPRISRYQRRLDRQHRTGSPACFDANGVHVKGSCRWSQRSTRANETQTSLAKAHRQAANARRDVIHKASCRAATTYAVNVVEDLNVSGMGRRGRGKRGFNGAVHDAALAEFRRQLAYKSAWYGSMLWVASRWYPSSKTCSSCRTRKSGLPRSARVFSCDNCGLVIDRDLNAAKNLAALAELACLCLMAQLMTGKPVDWSSLPLRPAGWELDQDTRSSRGRARAGGRKADGGERETSQQESRAGYCSFDREAAVAATLSAASGVSQHDATSIYP